MNWRVWAAFIVIVGATAGMGAFVFMPDRGQIIEPTSEYVTHIYVDLDQPYEGTVTVTYPEEGVSEEDFWAVVAALRDVAELLDQYYVPYEDPEDVRVRRRGGEVSMSFPLVAKERLDFLFPEVVLVGSWLPLWETLRVTVVLPTGYSVKETSQEGLKEGLDATEWDGRWELTGEAHIGGRADFTILYFRTDQAQETP